MPHYLLVRDRLKGFRKAGNQSNKAVVRRMGMRPSYVIAYVDATVSFRSKMRIEKVGGNRVVDNLVLVKKR